MKQQSSLARLWSYLKAYRFSVFFAVFLKIVSVIMSVIEPFVLGLAITELTSNLLAMANGVAGAGYQYQLYRSNSSDLSPAWSSL